MLPGCAAAAVLASADGGPADVAAAAETDAPDGKRLGDPCSAATECDDGVFCDGPEECFDDRCIGARSTVCRDFGGCAATRCDEGSSTCIVDLPPGACASGKACAPEIGCVALAACTGDAVCDDARACTDDHC
ncbi:MAG: hypothetical protein ABI175_09965, partial [Polyangiales bacterium]